MSHDPNSHSECCRNCGAPLAGPYCAQCGQAEVEGHPPTVKHFLHELFHELEHVDGKVFRTLRLLLFCPGALTQEYWAGRVVSFVRPIRIFLIAAALHLFISNGVGPMNYHVSVERAPGGALNLNVGPDPQSFRTGLNGRKPVPEKERREMEEKFDHAYLSIRYSSVLMFGLISWLLYRKDQPWFVNHLIAGLNFYSVWYLVAALASLPGRLNPVWNRLGLLSLLYLFFALRRLYGERWPKLVLKTLILFVALLATDAGLALLAGAWAGNR